MPSQISAGDAVNSLNITSSNDGAMKLTVGPNGSKVDAISIDSAGKGTLLVPPVNAANPCFSAYANANQSIPSNAETKLQFQIKEFDISNAFDNATNYRFQPLVAGYYQVSGNVTFAAPAGNPTTYLIIWKNGTSFKSGVSLNPVGTAPRLGVSALIFLNGSTDYVELACFQNTGSALSTINGSTLVYFQAALISRSA